MALTLEDLAARVDRMERELDEIKARSEQLRSGRETHRLPRGWKLITAEERQAFSTTLKEIVAEMGGGDVQPVDPKELRERIREHLRAQGLEERNWFSRTIREMREE